MVQRNISKYLFILYIMIWDALPTELLQYIKPYISSDVLCRVSKQHFIEKYDITGTLLRRIILKTIRNDYWFVFQVLLEKHYLQWEKFTRYRYQGSIYKNFIDFLSKRIIEEQSGKCKQILHTMSYRYK